MHIIFVHYLAVDCHDEMLIISKGKEWMAWQNPVDICD